jgi:hypothetical protein
MQRRASLSWVMLVSILIIFATLVISVRAEPLAQQREAQITSPETNAELHGVVPIVGSASVPNFKFYKIEFGVGPSPNQWAILGSLHETSVVNGQLEVWDTTRLPDGVYSLRLQVVKKDGNYDEFFVRQLVIANSRPTPSATPAETPTLMGVTPTPISVITPQATSTVRIIAPTAGLTKPSPTPTIVRRVQTEKLPIEPRSWGQAFCFGAAAMGVVFVVLGIVFGLRRLL